MSRTKINEWQSYYADIGIAKEFRREYNVYLEQSFAKRLPPIFEIEHLSLLLGRPSNILWSMVYGTTSFYRAFEIKKRSGGTRKIVAPYPSLLESQRWILDNILSRIKISTRATAFHRKASILHNARMHCGRETLLKFDLEDFFPTITFRRVISVFLAAGYPQGVSFVLARLCTFDGRLPQGAATSPALSNIICRRLDKRLAALSRNEKLRYTRYADDICFSGKYIGFDFWFAAEQIIKDEGFKLNHAKVRLLGSGDKKIVTGLDITSGEPRPTRAFRRNIKKDVYFVWSSGLSSHLSRRKIFDPNYLDHLLGRVRFWQTIEPQNGQMMKCLSRIEGVRKVSNRIIT